MEENMVEQIVIHKQLEPLLVATFKKVVQKRADISSLFEPLRQACGEAICGPAMTIFHYGAVKDGLLVEVAFPVSRKIDTGQVHTRLLDAQRAWTMVHHGTPDTLRE